jgi:hypothetical protein
VTRAVAAASRMVVHGIRGEHWEAGAAAGARGEKRRREMVKPWRKRMI